MSPEKTPVRPADKEKKSYSTPRLEVYGTLKEITKAVGNKGNSDGGVPPMFRTH